MADVIHLKDEDITKELFDRADFIFWAAGGAMGEGGAGYEYQNWHDIAVKLCSEIE